MVPRPSRVRSLAISALLIPSLAGCEMLRGTTCMPQPVAEACLNEAHACTADSPDAWCHGKGLGPACSKAYSWAQAHSWAVGGKPPQVQQ